MKIQQTVPEEEMVSEFLCAELQSPRFGQRYRNWLVEHELPPQTDVLSLPAEKRREILRAVRPGLFATLPNNIVWHEVQLSYDDWHSVMYMNDVTWTNFSHGTRLVTQGSDRLGQPHHEKLTLRVNEITGLLRAGQEIPKIILVTTPDCERLVLLEGHVRATTYVASNLYREREVAALLGISERMDRWAWW